MFRAVSRGGFSLIKGASIGNQDYYNGLLGVGKIADVSYANMSRLYAYNHLSLSSRINQNTEQMDGFAIPSSAEKLMQAIYLNMTDRRMDQAAFDIYTKKVLYDIKYNNLSPHGIFRDSVAYYRNSNKQFVRRITEEEVSSYDYAGIHKILSDRFSNAADFTFFFTGNNASSYKDLAVKYIGAIPGKASARENWLVVPNYLAKGHVEKRFLAKMSVPRSYAGLTLSCAKGFSAKNYVLAQMLEAYASSIFKDELYTNVPLYNIKGSDRLHSCSSGSISDQDFASLKKQVNDRLSQVSKTPKYWLSVLETRQISGKDLTAAAEAVNTVSKKDFCSFVKDVLSGNRITVIMDGTTADIPTLQLLQENEFIRNFFDVN